MGTSLLWQTDSQLHDAVQRQLDWEADINAKDVAVMASDGVITLTGFVNTYGEKFSAERAVKRVRGVRAVANDIHAKLRDERSDPEIARDAVHTLQSHTRVPRSVTVTVRCQRRHSHVDGQCELVGGEARSRTRRMVGAWREQGRKSSRRHTVTVKASGLSAVDAERRRQACGLNEPFAVRPLFSRDSAPAPVCQSPRGHPARCERHFRLAGTTARRGSHRHDRVRRRVHQLLADVPVPSSG